MLKVLKIQDFINDFDYDLKRLLSVRKAKK